MDIEGWTVIDEAGGVAFREYAFARGAYATSLALRGPEGWIVLSPPPPQQDRAMQGLAELAPIRALVATNDHHHMGQRAWRARFPAAESFAPAGCLAPLRRKLGDVPMQPLEALEWPEHVRYTETRGFVSGETLLAIDGAGGPILFVGDVLANIERMPGPPLRWLFTLSGSAPGFRPFRLANFAFVKDRGAVRAQLLALIDAVPPALIVPAHGPPVRSDDLQARARDVVRAL